MLRDWDGLYEDLEPERGNPPPSIYDNLQQSQLLIPYIWSSIPDSIKNNAEKLNWIDMRTYREQYFVKDREPYIAIIEISPGKYAIDIVLRNKDGI